VAVIVAAATFGAWVVGEIWLAGRRRRDGTTGDRGSRLVVQVALLAGCVLATWSARGLPGAAMPDLRVVVWIGIAVAWCGMLLRWWSVRHLGRLFTVTVVAAADQAVVNTGPYRLLRHPAYSGLLLFLGGLGLMLQNWVALAALTLLPGLGLAYRIRVEEAAMEQTVGEPYRRFAATRKRLIPYVW